MNEPATLARVLRSGLEESVHLGHVAVCDGEAEERPVQRGRPRKAPAVAQETAAASKSTLAPSGQGKSAKGKRSGRKRKG